MCAENSLVFSGYACVSYLRIGRASMHSNAFKMQKFLPDDASP